MQSALCVLLFLGSIVCFVISCMVGLTHGNEDKIWWVLILRGSEATFVISVIWFIYIEIWGIK